MNGWGGTNSKKSSVTPCRWTDVLINDERKKEKKEKKSKSF